ncbi:hypothetical protein SDC9_192943 [bioreactor metagenome]|uniref:Uncharacterized protein n=1 Tax=bioreactor metagenome TaxID=1076179 RepID=A0A645I3C7_9ZZZZ
MVVESIEMLLDSEEGPREPEKAGEGEPEKTFSSFMFVPVGVIAREVDGVLRKQESIAEECLVIRLAGHNSMFPCGREPQLDHRIQSEITVQSRTVEAGFLIVSEFGRQTLFQPTVKSERPPCGPFRHQHPVGTPEIRDGVKSFHHVHAVSTPSNYRFP